MPQRKLGMMTNQQSGTASKDEHEAVREIESTEIFRGDRTVVITHDGVQYRLHITRNNKLILHK